MQLMNYHTFDEDDEVDDDVGKRKDSDMIKIDMLARLS